MRFNWLKLAALIANVAIVMYLVRIAMQPHAKRSDKTPTSAVAPQE